MRDFKVTVEVIAGDAVIQLLLGFWESVISAKSFWFILHLINFQKKIISIFPASNKMTSDLILSYSLFFLCTFSFRMNFLFMLYSHQIIFK